MPQVIAADVEVLVKCQGIPKPLPVTFPGHQLIGPQVRAWCLEQGLVFESWQTRYED